MYMHSIYIYIYIYRERERFPTPRRTIKARTAYASTIQETQTQRSETNTLLGTVCSTCACLSST